MVMFRMSFRATLLAPLLLTAASAHAAAQAGKGATRICLAPTSVEASGGSAAAAGDAAREALTSFLAGPSLRVEPLQARLASQVREEGRQNGCRYLLLTTLKHERKRRGGNLLGRIAAGAVEQGAYEATMRSGSTAGRIVGRAAYGVAGQAAYDYARTIQDRDEIALGYRLETSDGQVLVDRTDKRKAKSDGEDLLSPMVQSAAEAVVSATRAP